MAKLKLPFELEKPSSNEYVTQSSQIGHDGLPLDYVLEGLDNISKESTQSEEQAIVFETDGGTQVGKIDANGADFINLKCGGQQVARMSDLPTVPTLDTSIGSSPSNSHTPSSKAVKDYVDAHSGIGDLPIIEETTASDDEEMQFSNDAGTQTYAKVGNYGIKSKAYLDMEGNNVIPIKDASIGSTPSQTNVPTSKAVADYLDAHGGVGNLPISSEEILSDEEEIIYGNNAATQEYVKVGSYGIKAKAYLDMQGNPIGSGNTIYIGNGREYTTLRAGIAAAVLIPNTKVIVEEGTYDLTQEFATEVANTLTSEIGIKIGNGVHVFFEEGAKVLALFPTNRTDISEYFAPFGVAGMAGGFTLENLDIEASNTRYCVHDEHGGAARFVRNYYINCRMKMTNKDAEKNWYSQCIGGGNAKHTYVEIRNCYFENPWAQEVRKPLVSYHNPITSADNGAQSKIIISNCYFADKGTVRCTWLGGSTKMSTTIVNNCSLGEEPYCQQEGSGTSVVNMQLITYNNEIRSNQ